MRKPRVCSVAVAIIAACLCSAGEAAGTPPVTQKERIAQQSDSGAADASLQRAIELFQEGTAESLRAAIPYFEEAARFYEQAGNSAQQALAQLGLGRVYDLLAKKQRALEYYEQALPLLRAVGDRPGEAVALNNIGGIYDAWGEKRQALEYYERALPLRRAVDDRGGEARTLNNIGLVYDTLGEKQQALEYYERALPLSRAVGDRRQEATTLTNIGLVYSALGEKRRALEYYERALPLSRAVGDRRQEARTLNNIGWVYDALGENQRALEYYEQALSLLQAVGDRRQEATTLTNIGVVYSDLGENRRALEYYERSLPLSRVVGDRSGEALTLNNIGAVYSDLGEKQTALEYYERALPLSRAVGDRSGEATTLGNIAGLQRSQGQLTEALANMERAIGLIEELRSLAPSGELRQTFFSTVQDRYQFYIELLMQLHQQNPQKGYDALAFYASERSRARSLIELLTEAGADIRKGVDPELLEKERDLLRQLNEVERRRHDLVSGNYSDAELDAINEQSRTLLAQLDQLETRIRAVSPAYANLQYPEPLTLEGIQNQVLDDETILLEYALGETESYLWLVTQNSITSYVLPPRKEIETAVENFRASVTSDNTAGLSSGLPLSEMILAPAAAQLGNKRLLIVGDGVLQYVPFVALPLPDSPDTPLLVQNEIVTLSSASTVAIQRQQLANRSPADKILAVLADPVFDPDDPRITGTPQLASATLDELALERATRNLGLGEGGNSFPRLKFTREEAETILALVPENQRLQALDFQASREIATDSDLAQYQIIHLATHGLLDPKNPELSGVVLSLFDETGTPQNGFLRLGDIFNLNLPAELVVLSACQTGLGENISGEGLVGLTRGFMYAGSRRVVVSLWSVNDASTSEVMARFYQKMLEDGLDAVTALREAQLEMWNSQQWQSPYYWAAFTIQGDWQ
ncbi:CHAT domain-containing tetratricopeptide repeat protein [Lyngbya sp. CCY1209]|uniref:CHAT domain-containing protein n=1 Tax=Lyngbya sp. CCY1209 TaxID=2886103 RepID=UPI002D1FFA2C|nr:CHAT domain-containing tetratricopeptide repeat protein [Lyngbya sp. CCY1209]MEB3885233.1 tetratricopeptide repeat protein [Lyngbya sp. CCY1209]